MATNSPNQQKKLSEYSIDELKTELKDAYDKGDMQRVQEISGELLSFEKAENAKIELSEKQKEFVAQMEKDPKKVKKEDLIKFITTDLKDFRSTTDSKIEKIESFKDGKIKELEAQLSDYEKATTELPSLLDVISPKTRRINSIGKKINAIKDKLPTKDVLIYCMTTAKGIFLGKTRGWIKRNRVNLMKKRKTASIVQSEDLKKVKDMLAPDTTSRLHWRETIKKILLKTINELQEKYAGEVKTQITG